MKHFVLVLAMLALLAGCAQQHRDLRPMVAKLDMAVNAHDVDAAMMMFADNASVKGPQGDMHEGKAAVREWMQGLMPGFHVESEEIHQSGDTVMWESTARSDAFAQSGVNPVDVNTMAVFDGDKITYFSSSLDDETQGKMRFAKFFQEVIQKRNVNAIDDFLAENFVEHEQLPPNTPPGREGVKAYFSMIEGAFPDLTVTPVMFLADGDKVLAFTRWEGTNKGKFMGKPATNRKVSFDVMDLITVANGKATEHWGISDEGAMMRQLAGK